MFKGICIEFNVLAGKRLRAPGAVVTERCEPLDMGAGDEFKSSGRAVVLLSAEPSLHPQNHFPLVYKEENSFSDQRTARAMALELSHQGSLVPSRH